MLAPWMPFYNTKGPSVKIQPNTNRRYPQKSIYPPIFLLSVLLPVHYNRYASIIMAFSWSLPPSFFFLALSPPVLHIPSAFLSPCQLPISHTWFLNVWLPLFQHLPSYFLQNCCNLIEEVQKSFIFIDFSSARCCQRWMDVIIFTINSLFLWTVRKGRRAFHTQL